MKARLRFSLAAALALALESCEAPEIELAISTVDGRQVIGLSQDWGLIFSRKKPPCVHRIDMNASSPESRPLVWRLETQSGHCIYLSHFVIGQVPAGFVERIPLRITPHGWFDFEVQGAGDTGEEQFQLG